MRDDEMALKNIGEENNLEISVLRDENGNPKGFNMFTKTVTRKIMDPKDVVEKTERYSREIPCYNDLFILYYMASKHGLLEKDADIIKAFLLRWIQNNTVELIQKQGIFSKNKPIIIFKQEAITIDPLENKLYQFLKKISENDTLNLNKFQKWLQKNEIDFNLFLSDLKFDCEERMVKKGLMVPIQSDNDPENSVVLRKTSYQILPTYHECLNGIVEFKKFIQEFTLMKEKTIEETNLWNEYLVASQLLGIAQQTSNQLAEILPNFKSKPKRVRIKVPANIPRDQIPEYLENELDRMKNNQQ